MNKSKSFSNMYLMESIIS